jgi:hypothetical protein
MKYSQTIGLAAALIMIGLCFLPWSFVASKQLVITGMDATGTNFGKPGLFNLILCTVLSFFFLVPRIWAKRTNVFIAAFNLAWSFRNYLLVTSCMMGECPEKKPAIFILLGLAIIAQLMALFPKMQVPVKKAD